MNKEEIKSCIKKSVILDIVNIEGDENHLTITAIGKIFLNLSNVKKQQIIYQPLMKYITEKKIHAISIYTFTPEEWKKKNKFLSH